MIFYVSATKLIFIFKLPQKDFIFFKK